MSLHYISVLLKYCSNAAALCQSNTDNCFSISIYGHRN